MDGNSFTGETERERVSSRLCVCVYDKPRFNINKLFIRIIVTENNLMKNMSESVTDRQRSMKANRQTDTHQTIMYVHVCKCV